MISVSSDELDKLPKIGKTVKCWICNKRHRVKYGKSVDKDGRMQHSMTIAFFKCGKEMYVCGIGGKELNASKK